MSDADFVEKLKDYLFLTGGEEWKEIVENAEENYWLQFAPDIKVRLQTLEQFREHGMYFFLRPEYLDPELIHREKMKITPAMMQAYMPDLIHLLEHITDAQWNREYIKEELVSFIAAKELKNGQVLRPVRAILTGVQASPGAFEMLEILGKEESLVRLRAYE